jgi:prepilin-type N-terminal cleavage/methylation domain-containing protein
MFKHLKKQNGFTLVELLVVVIILAVLAAIVIPQLRSSSQDAKLSALDADLSTLRSSIELYYNQHNAYPGVIKQHNGVAHTSAEDAFVKQLTFCSKDTGDTSNVCDATYKFGPYIKKAVPKNPLPNAATTTDPQMSGVNVDAATATLGTAAANDATAKGWFFVQQTGEFFANNTTYSSR